MISVATGQTNMDLIDICKQTEFLLSKPMDSYDAETARLKTARAMVIIERRKTMLSKSEECKGLTYCWKETRKGNGVYIGEAFKSSDSEMACYLCKRERRTT